MSGRCATTIVVQTKPTRKRTKHPPRLPVQPLDTCPMCGRRMGDTSDGWECKCGHTIYIWREQP
jgi:hypothetical protein